MPGLQFRDQSVPLWPTLCSRREIPKLQISPSEVDDHVLRVLVQCMAQHPTGLREIEFGTFKILMTNQHGEGHLNLGFGRDGQQHESLEVTHVPTFGNDEARFVAALLETLTQVKELNLSFCGMKNLDVALKVRLTRGLVVALQLLLSVLCTLLTRP